MQGSGCIPILGHHLVAVAVVIAAATAGCSENTTQHEVVIVSGPVEVDYPSQAKVIPVISTEEMLTAATEVFASCDGLIGAAAVFSRSCPAPGAATLSCFASSTLPAQPCFS